MTTHISNLDNFQKFIRDESFERANEALKRTDNLLDIFEPGENNHSEILSWLFNPREGHGQGDAIFKDFLIAASESKTDNDSETNSFFKKWTPGRIANTGFQALIIQREHQLETRCRLDLLMIDPVNCIIVVVENKRRAHVREKQLEGYRKELNELFKTNGFVSGKHDNYSVAYVVLDSKKTEEEYETDEEEDVDYDGTSHERKYWAHISYQWLERGARRAQAQQRRGNMSASLVISYCQRQSGYVSPDEQVLEDAVADLANRYRDLLSAFKESKAIKTFTADALSLGTPGSDLTIFVHSHPELVTKLLSVSRIAFVKSQLDKLLNQNSYEVKAQQVRLRLFYTEWDHFWNSVEGQRKRDPWPLQIVAKILSKSQNEISNEAPLYQITVDYRRDFVLNEDRSWVEDALKNAFPKTRVKEDSLITRYGRMTKIPETKVSEHIKEIFEKTVTALSSAKK